MRAAGTDWSPWLARPGTAAVLTDFDGTLAPIVVDREKARPLPGTRKTLAALAGRVALVAVVSGRPVDYLAAHLGGTPGLRLVGLYGMESIVDGERATSPQAEPWEPVVSACARAAEQQAPPGVDVEVKGLAVALHARAHPELFPWVKDWAGRQSEASGLLARPGRLSVELLPPIGLDKGTVVQELAGSLDAVSFFGDDTGDLPAFAALRRLRAEGKPTLAVGVASPEQPEGLPAAVDVLVDGPEEALSLLGGLVAGLRPG